MIAQVLVAGRGLRMALPLDYLVPEAVTVDVGDVVQVPLRGRSLRGVVVGVSPMSVLPVDRLRKLTRREPGPSVPNDLLELWTWLREDLLCRDGEAVSPLLPPACRRIVQDMAYAWSGPEHVKGSVAERVRLLLGAGPMTRSSLRAQEISSDAVRRLSRRGFLTEVPQHADEEREERGPGAQTTPALSVQLTAAQNQARQALIEAQTAGEDALLFGVTGSGKTEVYLSVLAPLLASGGQAIVLVPEIALTPQARWRYRAKFGEAAQVLHSALSPSERRSAWERLASGKAKLAIGPRSAVWAPVARPQLIIVDEEPDPAYQSESAPRYDARRVAERRAHAAGGSVIYGSATPSLEAYARAVGEGVDSPLRLVSLPTRVHGLSLPEVELVDMRRRPVGERRTVLSTPLADALDRVLLQKEQAVLLLNRRGVAPAVVCRDCGRSLRCSECSVGLTLHGTGLCLCHYCGRATPLPVRCPSCRGTRLRSFGAGTERLVNEVKERFPTARVLRLDRDATIEAGGAEPIIRQFSTGGADILVGTQMVAKGHDFPGVTLVGMVAADLGLSFPDFRAAERTFSLITQAAGRAGRGSKPGQVIVQGFEIDHPAVQAAVAQDYDAFARTEMRDRRELGYPPFAHMASALISAREEREAIEASQTVAEVLQTFQPAMKVRGPAPALVAKREGRFLRQVIMLSERPGPLREAVQTLADVEFKRTVRIDWTFDPQRVA